MGRYFPAPGNISDYCNDPATFEKHVNDAALVSESLQKKLEKTGRVPRAGDVKYVFLTSAGPGPLHQPPSEGLLDPTTGLPRQVGNKHKRLQIKDTTGKLASKADGTGGNGLWMGIALGVALCIGARALSTFVHGRRLG